VRFIRKRLVWIAVLWIAGQLTTLAATPLGLCCASATAVAADNHVCCEGMAPGQYCPLHKHRNGSSEKPRSGSSPDSCALKGGCTPQPAGLEAFAVGPAILPSTPCTKDTDLSSIVSFVCARVISRSSPPVSPPPRT